MSITMIQPCPDRLPGWYVPKLHQVIAPVSANKEEIRQWCKQNCRSEFYTLPSWTSKNGVQFVDDQDANEFKVWSMLRWHENG